MRADEPRSAEELMLFGVLASVDLIVHASQKINYGCVSSHDLASDRVQAFDLAINTTFRRIEDEYPALYLV
jgi:hypothetical protein